MSEQLALLGGAKTVTLPWPGYPVINHEEVNAAVRVVMSGFLSDCGRGEFIATLEDDFAAYFGARYALGLVSGTAALHSAMFAVGVCPGSEVLIANHNWISPIMAVFQAGAVPVLCDVAPRSFSIDPAEIRRKVTPHTKAIIATHLWGIPAEMDGIMAAARELNLPVIEDVSHAHGGRYKGQYLGTIGDIGCFSLQGSKAMVAGEGGFLLTNAERYFQRAMVPGLHPSRLGEGIIMEEVKPFAAAGGMYMYRMPTISAAIACAQLKKLSTFNAARQANFDRLYAQIGTLPFLSWPVLDEGSVRGWYGTPGFYDETQACGVSRDRFVAACKAEGMMLLGEGYTDYSQLPTLQDLSLLGQMYTYRYPNGVAYAPISQGTLPHNDEIRRTMLLYSLPAVESPQLMDQCAETIRKVAANLDAVAAYEPVAV